MKRYLAYLVILFSTLSNAQTWTEEGGSSIANGINVAYVNVTSSLTMPTGTNSITGGGAGTGLDADKLDGKQGSYYLSASTGAQTEANTAGIAELVVTSGTFNSRFLKLSGGTMQGALAMNTNDITNVDDLTALFVYAGGGYFGNIQTSTAYLKTEISAVKASTSSSLNLSPNVIKASHTAGNYGSFANLEVAGIIVSSSSIMSKEICTSTITPHCSEDGRLHFSTGVVFASGSNGIGVAIDFSQSGLSGNSGYYLYGDADSFWRANSQFQEANLKCANIDTYSGNTLDISANGVGDIRVNLDSDTDLYLGGLAYRTTWYSDGRMFHDGMFRARTMALQNGATIQARLTAKQIGSGDVGTAGNVYTKFSSSDSWATAASGGGGSSNGSIAFPASTFWTDGQINYSIVDKVSRQATFANRTSTMSAFYVHCTGDVDKQFASAEAIMDKNWNGGAITGYMITASSGLVASKNVIQFVAVSTNPFTSNWDVVYDTVTLPTTAWNNVTNTLVIPTTRISAGQKFYILVGRDATAGTTAKEHSYIAGVEFVFTKN